MSLLERCLYQRVVCIREMIWRICLRDVCIREMSVLERCLYLRETSNLKNVPVPERCL